METPGIIAHNIIDGIEEEGNAYRRTTVTYTTGDEGDEADLTWKAKVKMYGNDRDHYCSGGFGPCFSDTIDHLDAAGDYCHRGRFMDFLHKAGWTVG